MNSLNNYTITSPGYPYGYAPDLTCEWIFSTTSENHLYIVFNDVNLANDFDTCILDRVDIYNGISISQNWELLTQICTPNITNANKFTSTNLMKIVFKSDSVLNQTGFSATIGKDCGGTIINSDGILVVDNSTIKEDDSTECIWKISVRSGRRITIKFVNFNLGKDNDKKCKSYVLFKNGESIKSPILGEGKYCGNSQLPSILKTSGNNLFIKFSTEVVVPGFTLEYKELPTACGGTITLTHLHNSANISSPNYPSIPTPHTECMWIVMGPPGESLMVDFIERFDLTSKYNCTVEYVEIRSGGLDTSPLMGRWCKDIPSTQKSVENIIFLKFFTDTDDPKNGFKATVAIAKCGGVIRGSSGLILSPFYNIPNSYPKNIRCTWKIIGPRDHYLTLTFNTLDLEGDPCITDSVDIIEYFPINATEVSLGTFCKSKPDLIQTAGNQVTVTFKATSHKSKKHNGFSLYFNASQEECGGEINGESGYIQSPGYPIMNHFHRTCEWIIKVPKGRRIIVKILDFDLDRTLGLFAQGLAFFNGKEYKIHITYLTPDDTTKYVNSTDNIMTIYFWSFDSSEHRGFKLKYTSDEPSGKL